MFKHICYVHVLRHACIHRLGSVSADGVARLRGHPGLEHFLPHPGHGHLKAADVIALSQRTYFSAGRGAEPSDEAQEMATHLGLLSVEGLGQRRAGGGRAHCGLID